MTTAIIRKAFKDQDKLGFRPLFYISTLNKFLLKAFNRFLYNYKISRSLIVGFLLDLPNYYTFYTLFQSINIFLLKTKFLLLMFG